MNYRSTFVSLAFAATAMLSTGMVFGQDSQSGKGKPEPPMAGVHWTKGEAANHSAKPGGSPNLIWHNGPVMFTTQTTAIFWGPSWNNASFVGDKISGLQSFYQGIGYTSYARTNTEYSDANGKVTDTITFNGSVIDSTAVPGNPGNRTTPILEEVCKMIPNPVANGYYPVYVDASRGHAGFCAWHSAGSCGSTPVQFAFFFNLDGDAGCDPQDSSGLHSQGLAALANVSGHELSEALTDPRLNAWYDSSGSENSDKCAWTFGTPLLTFSNTSRWKIQGNWSNRSYNNVTGYPNSSGQRGCIDGGNFN